MTMSSQYEFKQLVEPNAAEKARILEIIVQACEDNPLVRAYCETPEMTLRTAEFRLAITLLGGQLWVLQRVGGEAGDIIGVACLEPPGKDQAIEDQIATLEAECYKDASPEWLEWRKGAAERAEYVKEAGPEPHADTRYWLAMLVVDRACRKQGHGKRMVYDLLKKCENEDKLLAMFCATELLPFYEPLGLYVLAQKHPLNLLSSAPATAAAIAPATAAATA